MPVVIQIAFGGAIGAALRHIMASLATRLVGAGFPWGTLVVNLVGCLGIGFAAVTLLQRGDPAAQRLAPFVVPGVLGGFTTFSAFTLETLQLMERGRLVSAAAYVGGSVALGLAALVAGMALARAWTGA